MQPLAAVGWDSCFILRDVGLSCRSRANDMAGHYQDQQEPKRKKEPNHSTRRGRDDLCENCYGDVERRSAKKDPGGTYESVGESPCDHCRNRTRQAWERWLEPEPLLVKCKRNTMQSTP